MSTENRQVAVAEAQVFNMDFIYNASFFVDLSEYLKKVRAFKALKDLSEEAHEVAVKACVAEVLILIRMVNEFPCDAKCGANHPKVR